MLNTGGFGSIGYIFPLTDLAFETNTRQPEILYTKNSVYILECGIELSAVIHVAWNEFRAERFQFLCGRLVEVTRKSADVPAICQKFSCNGSTLLTGCTGDCNSLIVHHLPL